MQPTELVWRLFLLLFPGIIATLIFRFITTNKNYTIFYFSVYAASFSIGTLIIMEIVNSLYRIVELIFLNHKLVFKLYHLEIWDNLFENKQTYNKTEFFIYYIIAIPMSIFWAYLLRIKVFIKFLQKIKLTARFGDDDVFSHYLNTLEVEWVLVNDYKQKLSFYGSIQSFSDSGEKREVVLLNVTVYDADTGEKKYDLESIYIELNNFEFSLQELPPKKLNST